MSTRISRRTFLTGSAGVAASALASPVLAQPQSQSGDKVRIGMIGVGGQGEFSWRSLANEDIRVLCDVDLARVGAAKQLFPKADVVQDFRKVIDRNDLDAVVVATPDHWHAIPTVWALKNGKHVYCEKPLGHSVYEARVMAETAKQQKRATQMGTQIHAGSNYRRVVELVRANAVGTVRRVDVWCEKQPNPGHRAASGTPPSTLDYALWLGPAPERPYDPNVVPFHWRWWWDFGGGVLADMGCHYMDLAHWALDLRAPHSVSATGTEFPNADNHVPVTMRVDYQYPARGSQPPVHLVWWHGITGPRDDQGRIRETGMHSGVLFTGDSGELLADYDNHRLLPEEKFRDYQAPPRSIPDSVGHHQEWVNAIKNGTPTTCNFDYSGALAEAVLLGNVAYRLQHEIHWDAGKLRVTNVRRDEWEPLIHPPYRGDWKLMP